jgi:hypothetical protein
VFWMFYSRCSSFMQLPHRGSVESTLRDMFTQPETLRVSEGNGWRPSKGAEKVDAYKGASLKRDGLPSLLQLHLKRFKYDYETGETSKINDCCSFPLVSLYYFKQAWEEKILLTSLCTIYLIGVRPI